MIPNKPFKASPLKLDNFVKILRKTAETTATPGPLKYELIPSNIPVAILDPAPWDSAGLLKPSKTLSKTSSPPFIVGAIVISPTLLADCVKFARVLLSFAESV